MLEEKEGEAKSAASNTRKEFYKCASDNTYKSF